MTRRVIRALVLTCLVAALGFSAGLSAGTGRASERNYACESKPLVVKIHADWCGSCRATQETWDKVIAELSDRATMVKFDVTDRASYEAAEAEAKRLGISDFLMEYKRRTGAIAILDCETQEPLVVLSGERDFTKYRDAIEQANPASS
jgi:thiol-disulfide isomerase/thioredoxin